MYNVVQNLIPKSQMLSIQAGTTIALVFDTDVEQTAKLKKNLELLGRYCGKLHIVFLPQVLNLEDELVRCTDVKNVSELTRSNSVRNFKSDFCKLKVKDCRVYLPQVFGEIFESRYFHKSLTEERNLYSSKKIRIPAPHFLVLYNGEEEHPNQVVMKLSEVYESAEETPELELIVYVLDINQGHNEALMKACQSLREYAAYTAKVRENIKAGCPVREAVEQAVTGCIREGILGEFLRRNRSEAMIRQLQDRRNL